MKASGRMAPRPSTYSQAVARFCQKNELVGGKSSTTEIRRRQFNAGVSFGDEPGTETTEELKRMHSLAWALESRAAEGRLHKISQNELRRVIGMLLARLPDLKLGRVDDPRRGRNRRWDLEPILTLLLLGILAGCKSLQQVEELAPKLTIGMRRRLKLPPRMADTTMRNVLVRLSPFEVRQALHRLMKAAERRHALEPLQDMPFQSISMDGKYFSIPSWDDHYAQQRTFDNAMKAYGEVRMVNSVLVTTAARPVLDAMPIPADTNEMGIFQHAFEALVREYGALFQMVMYDAGAASEDNMAFVRSYGKDFLFCIADERWLLWQKMKSVLGSLPESAVQARTEEVLSKSEDKLIVRELYIATAPKGYKQFEHVRTLLRVRTKTIHRGEVVRDESRYLVSSKEATALTADQWLALIRARWGVENNLHWTLDAIFKEDERTWFEASPRGAVVIALFRRMAYSILTLFRSVTLRSDENRQMPWARLIQRIYDALISLAPEQFLRLRERKEVTVVVE